MTGDGDALSAQTRCVAGAHGIPVAIPEQVCTAETVLSVYACWWHEGGVAALREQPVGALFCILRGLRRGRGWAAPCRAVNCAVLVVTDRAGGVEGVVGRWQTVDAVGAPGWLLVSKGAFLGPVLVGAER